VLSGRKGVGRRKKIQIEKTMPSKNILRSFFRISFQKYLIVIE